MSYMEQPEGKGSLRSSRCRAVRCKYFADCAGGLWLRGGGWYVTQPLICRPLDITPVRRQDFGDRTTKVRLASVIYHLESY